jgi:hypothetical protein
MDLMRVEEARELCKDGWNLMKGEDSRGLWKLTKNLLSTKKDRSKWKKVLPTPMGNGCDVMYVYNTSIYVFLVI